MKAVRNLEKRFCVSQQSPPIIMRVVRAGPRDMLGRPIRQPETCDSVRCTCNGNSYDRLPGETMKDFTDRVFSLQPKEDGKLLILMLLPRPDGEWRVGTEASSDKQRPSSNELTSPP